MLFNAAKNIKSNCDPNSLSEVYYLRGYTYDYNFGHFKKAIKYYKKSLFLKNKFHLLGKAKVYFRLGVIKYYQGLRDAAKKNLNLAIKFSNKERDKITKGKVYNVLGDISWNLNRNKYAEKAYLSSYRLLKNQDDKYSLAHIKTSIAMFYAEASDFKKAFRYIDEANKLAQELNRIGIIGTVLLGYGIIYFYKGDYHKSKKYLEKGLKLARDGFKNTKDPYIAKVKK